MIMALLDRLLWCKRPCLQGGFVESFREDIRAQSRTEVAVAYVWLAGTEFHIKT